MAAWVARLLLFVDVCLHVYGSYLPPVKIVEMDKMCQQLYNVREQFILRLTEKGRNYRPRWNCDLRLQARPKYRLVMRFKSVNIPRYTPSCRDYVQILDGFDSNVLHLTDLVCNNRGIPYRDLTTSNEKASVWFRSDHYGEDEGFEILITPSIIQPETKEPPNTIFIGIAVATSVLLLIVAIGMCCCVYCNRKKQTERRRRRRERRETLQLQMTLELTGITNPVGPPPTPDVTAPAYSPPSAPPPYSTLPRRHAKKDDTDTETGENPKTGEVTPECTEQPPPYEEPL